MRVISKTNTTKLVKGAIYDVVRLRNLSSNRNPNITILKLGNYTAKNFTQLDGAALPQLDWDAPLSPNKYNYIKSGDILRVGDLISCRYGSKYLIADKIYKISNIDVQGVGYGFRTRIKIDGLNRWLNPYRFRTLNKEEFRDISLDKIFDVGESYTFDKNIRSIDNFDDVKRQKIILGIIFDSIISPFRNNMNIVDWSLKSGKKWDLKFEDLDPYLNLTIYEIIKLME